MKCPQCDGNNFSWAKRCVHCGYALSESKAAIAPASGPRIPSMSGPGISLVPATSSQIDLFRACWPFGLHEWPGAEGGYGLVCRRPDREIMLVKFQQVDVPLATAHLVGHFIGSHS